MIEAKTGKRSLGSWIGLGFFSIAILTSVPALYLAGDVLRSPKGDSYTIAFSLLPFYGSVVAFLISVVIKPNKRQVLAFGIVFTVYVAMVFVDGLKPA